MSRIEPLVVLPVTTFYFPIVPGSEWADQLVADPKLCQPCLKHSGIVRAAIGTKALGKLLPIVRLDAFDPERCSLDEVFKKTHCRIRTMLIKGFYETPARELINGGELIEALSLGVTDQTGGRNELDIDLNALTGIIHLFIRFGDIFGIRRMVGHDPLPFEDAIKAGNGAGVAFLAKLNPKDDKAGMWIASAHSEDELKFVLSMLVGVMMGAS